MQPLDLNDFIEFNDQKINPIVLANEPDMRLLLLCLRAGQQIPEHSAAGSITVQAITGRATFYDGEKACEMFAGSLIRLKAGRPHRVKAHTDAALLVTMIKPSRVVEPGDEHRAIEREIDPCLLDRAERHPLIFAAFDSLAAFGLWI
jgi:quercetin dioxygenase-like cupin family protein